MLSVATGVRRGMCTGNTPPQYTGAPSARGESNSNVIVLESIYVYR